MSEEPPPEEVPNLNVTRISAIDQTRELGNSWKLSSQGPTCLFNLGLCSMLQLFVVCGRSSWSGFDNANGAISARRGFLQPKSIRGERQGRGRGEGEAPQVRGSSPFIIHA